jgi:hypothetical protein
MTLLDVGGISDFLENLFLLSFTLNYPTHPSTLQVTLASTFTVVKYACLFASMILVLLGFIKILFFGGSHPHQE